MKTAINCMFKNESVLFEHVLPLWKNYPINFFIFYDDNSTDNSIDVIKKHLDKDRFLIINDKLNKFNEGYQRQRMIDESRKRNVEKIFCIDADELLSSSILNDFENFIGEYDSSDLHLFWYNAVNDTLSLHRNDHAYSNNYRSFILPLKHTFNLDIHAWKYHTPRTPFVNLPKSYTKDYGIIHLQSCNKKYYALKQLWYKHYELNNFDHSVDFINSRYDSVVNHLNFNPTPTPETIISNIEMDLSFFDDLADIKGYTDYIKNNYNKQLITFGEEYL